MKYLLVNKNLVRTLGDAIPFNWNDFGIIYQAMHLCEDHRFDDQYVDTKFLVSIFALKSRDLRMIFSTRKPCIDSFRIKQENGRSFYAIFIFCCKRERLLTAESVLDECFRDGQRGIAPLAFANKVALVELTKVRC